MSANRIRFDVSKTGNVKVTKTTIVEAVKALQNSRYQLATSARDIIEHVTKNLIAHTCGRDRIEWLLIDPLGNAWRRETLMCKAVEQVYLVNFIAKLIVDSGFAVEVEDKDSFL